ncbi:putative 28S ribosomal protein S10, mitochondrial [Nymphon striatum]|nr:putative 28S ribosomal protein S10, mitochondrial [Nymphon striatum]
MLNSTKCIIKAPEIFFGRLYDANSVRPEPEKVTAIWKMASPTYNKTSNAVWVWSPSLDNPYSSNIRIGSYCLNNIRSYAEDNSNTQASSEPDKLYRAVHVEVRGHESEVLRSYQIFVTTVASKLGLNLAAIQEPKMHVMKQSLLKSRHIFKKHLVQYEIRTYFKVFEFKHLTGSTADTLLEYIQRNIPEGVAMKVTKVKCLSAVSLASHYPGEL